MIDVVIAAGRPTAPRLTSELQLHGSDVLVLVPGREPVSINRGADPS